MKTILILTAGYGEGHRTAARNLCEALRQENPPVRVEVIDLLEVVYGRANELLRRTYLAMINHAPQAWEALYHLIDSGTTFQEQLPVLAPMRRKLSEILARERPFAVVSTYPIYSCVMEDVPELPGGYWKVTLITDSISINSVWHRCPSDRFFVPNPETAAILAQRGVRHVEVLGFPVAQRFADRETEARAKTAPGPGEKWRVLYMINSGKREAPSIVRTLLQNERIALTVTVGRDNDLRREIEAAMAESGRMAEIIGWTDRMPDLLLDAHLLIGKAGGACVQEALAACTPMVMTKVVPGQEEGNARLLLENGCGALAETPEAVTSALADAFENAGVLWQEWYEEVKRCSRPHAARESAAYLLGLPSREVSCDKKA